MNLEFDSSSFAHSDVTSSCYNLSTWKWMAPGKEMGEPRAEL